MAPTLHPYLLSDNDVDVLLHGLVAWIATRSDPAEVTEAFELAGRIDVRGHYAGCNHR
jgi:hypothetical protein